MAAPGTPQGETRLPIACIAHDHDRNVNCPTCLLLGAVHIQWSKCCAIVDLNVCRDLMEAPVDH